MIFIQWNNILVFKLERVFIWFYWFAVISGFVVSEKFGTKKPKGKIGISMQMAFSSILQYCIICDQNSPWHKKTSPAKTTQIILVQVSAMRMRLLACSGANYQKRISSLSHSLNVNVTNFKFFNIFGRWTDTVRAKMAKSNG